jgi:hemerythrin-like domain-containing protein
LRTLVTLYVDHIWKEEYLLLPMADKVLSEDDHAMLCEHFDSLDAKLGAGKHHQMEQLSARLEHAL